VETTLVENCSDKREASLVFHIQRSDFRAKVLVSKGLVVVACLLMAVAFGHFVLRASIWSGVGIGVILGLFAANALPAIFPSFKPRTRTWQVPFRTYRWLRAGAVTSCYVFAAWAFGGLFAEAVFSVSDVWNGFWITWLAVSAGCFLVMELCSMLSGSLRCPKCGAEFSNSVLVPYPPNCKKCGFVIVKSSSRPYAREQC
jgi:hypothetical protein